MKGDKPMTVHTSLRNLLQKPSLLVNTPRARKEGGGEEKKRRRERRQRCSQLRHKHPRTHQKGRAPSYDESIQGRPRKRVRRGKREGKKERRRERERRERKVFPATNNRPGDTPKKEREDPEYYIHSGKPQKAKRERGREGGGKGEKGGLSSPHVPMNLEQTSVAATTCGLPEGCHL